MSDSIDGFYGLYYTGNEGVGFAVLVLREGSIVGADGGGTLYDGKFELSSDDERIRGSVKMEIPVGMGLVTGGTVEATPRSFEFPLDLARDFANGNPVRLNLPIGPVNVIFRKIREI